MIRARFAAVTRVTCVLMAISAVSVPALSSAATRTTTAKKATSSATARKPAVKKSTTTAKAVAASKAKTTASRRLRASRVRAARQAAALREALEPRFKFDDTGNVVPDIRAEAAIIYDPENGKVLWESNSTSRSFTIDSRCVCSMGCR